MARPRTPSEKRQYDERNAGLVEWLVREKSAYLHGVAVCAGAPSWRLEDVVQAGLLDFYRAFPGPEVHEAALAYCAACVASQASKARRRYARKESHETGVLEHAETREQAAVSDHGVRDPAEQVVERERIADLRERVAQLPEDQRAVVVLAAAGYSPAEIAELRDLSLRQVRKRIEKANRRLRSDD